MLRRIGAGLVRHWRALLLGLLALGAALCLLRLGHLAGLLETQKAAERWQGDNPQRYSQVSAFLPVDANVGLEEIYTFRGVMLERLREALPDQNDRSLFVDAWSASAKLHVASDGGRGEARAVAVGGSFFQFHPLLLLDGSYIAEGDLMQDRVLLDEDLAWLLFGGTELSGMEMRIEGKPFVVAGVIRREQDFASRKAYTDGMGLFMSFEALRQLDETASVSCYEAAMAEPVRHFALNLLREKFPLGDGAALENTGRFSYGRLLDVIGQFGSRSMQSRGILYPYWENAARCVEDWCALLLLAALLMAAAPCVGIAVPAVRLLRRGGARLSEELLPAWREKAGEAIRVRQRRRWLRRHGEHEE